MESELYKEIFGDGEARGAARGKTEGKTEGKAEGKAEDVLAVLAARGIVVSDAIRARILGCTEIPTLDLWIRRAAVASTAAAVVRAKTPPRARASEPAARAPKT